MFYDRWSTKVMLPLGAKWGNNIGGVAACLSWSGGRPPKPPPRRDGEKPSILRTNKSYAHQYTPMSNKTRQYVDLLPSDEKYINITPWEEDLGITRVDDNLQLTGPHRGLDDYYHEDVALDTVRDVSRRQDLDKYARFADYRAGTPPRPPSTGRGYSHVTKPKGYGFMGPPPPRKGSATPTGRRSVRPANPSPQPATNSRQEVYKYTEREMIIEDLEGDAGTKRKVVNRSFNTRPNSRAGYDRLEKDWHRAKVHGAHRPGSSNFGRYYTDPSPVNFRPTPLVWQTREPIGSSKICTSRPSTAGPYTGKDVQVSMGTSGQRSLRNSYTDLQKKSATAKSNENITIHVDCAKLVNTARPTSVTVRLHGVDSVDAENLKITSSYSK